MSVFMHRWLVLGLVAVVVLVSAPAGTTAQSGGPRPTGPDDVYLTHGQAAARWSARITPWSALLFAFVVGASGPDLCEHESCAGTLEHAIGGAMVGTGVGALTGAVLGLLFHDPGATQPSVPPPGTGQTRWSLSGGLPNALESAGYGSCEAPKANTALHARVGRPVGRGFDGFVEVGSVRFGDNGCEGQGGPIDQVTIDQTARSTLLGVGLSRPLAARERLVLDVMAGVARTTMTTTPLTSRQPAGPPESESGVGLHLGGALRAGWWPGFGGRLRMGATVRGDWVFGSPMGTVPLLTLSIGFWG